MFKASKHFVSIAGIVLVLQIVACKPSIKVFRVLNTLGQETLKTTPADSLILQYKVKGNASIIFNEAEIDERKFREFTLVAERSGDTIQQLKQVEVLAAVTETEIVFRCKFNNAKDSLVAEGTKNVGAWDENFVVSAIINTVSRELSIFHEGVTTTLKPNETTNAFDHLPVQGNWSLRSALSKSEQADHSNLPGTLQITATVKRK